MSEALRAGPYGREPARTRMHVLMARAVATPTRTAPALAGRGDILSDSRAEQGKFLLQQLRATIDALDGGCARPDQRLKLPVTHKAVELEDRHRSLPQRASLVDVFVGLVGLSRRSTTVLSPGCDLGRFL